MEERLASAEPSIPVPSLGEELLTVAEAAAIAQRSVRTIRRAYLAGRLTAFRDGNGRGVRILRGDLHQWMTERPVVDRLSSEDADLPEGRMRHRRLSAQGSGASENLMLLKAARRRRS